MGGAAVAAGVLLLLGLAPDALAYLATEVPLLGVVAALLLLWGVR